MHFTPIPGTTHAKPAPAEPEADPVEALLVDFYGFTPDQARAAASHYRGTENNKTMAAEDNAKYLLQNGADAYGRRIPLDKEANAKYKLEHGLDAYGRPIGTKLDIGPAQVTPATKLDIGPVQVTPAPPKNNLEYLKQMRAAHNEKVSALKMLQETVHAQDAQNANEMTKGSLWGAITPGAYLGQIK